jgi:GTP cyclohydrolase I
MNKQPLAPHQERIDQAIPHVKALLDVFGVPMLNEGRKKTPERYAKFLAWMFADKEIELTTFSSEQYSGMVVSSNIKFYSLCEHHLLPFFGTAAIAYLPGKKVIGISKLARIVEYEAQGVQMQERMTGNILDTLHDAVQPRGVAVLLRGRHLCQEMRGVRSEETWTTTTAYSGEFELDEHLRKEFLSHVYRDG